MNSAPPKPGRILAIDVARVFAILFMIQGHTIHVLLAPQYQQGSFFDWWLFLRGLTAPVFMSLAGASFFVASMRVNANAVPKPGRSLRRIKRFASFICLGYLMHMPARSFADLPYVDGAGFDSWCQVDVLQCIGITLIALQLLTLLFRTPQRYALASLVIGSSIILATPLTWAANWNQYHVPGAFSAYLNGNSGSLFPLFPWAGYVFIGAALGYIYATRPTAATVRTLLLLAVITFMSGQLLQRVPWNFYGNIDYWKTSPDLFLVRWGSVAFLLALITAAVRWFPTSLLPSAKMLASESLIAYLIHIAILYGSSWNTGLRQVIGESLNPVQTLGFIGLMIVVSCLLAMGWHLAKRKFPALFWTTVDAGARWLSGRFERPTLNAGD